MKINIKVMRQEVFTVLQSNYKKVHQMIEAYPNDSSWLSTIANTDDIYETKQYTINDFQLLYDQDYKKVEFQNGILIYENLKDLPRYILCSMRFWAWFIFEKAYEQSQVAMKLTEDVVRNFWLENDNRRAIMLNVMARQFFKVEVSKNDMLKDKYHLTEYLFQNHSLYKNFAYRNICMLPNVSGAILNASYFLYKKYPIKQPENIISSFVKHVSRIGSTQLVDIIPEDKLFYYLCVKMEPIMKELYNEIQQ